MFWPAVFVCLSTLALLAGLSIARRIGYASRAERLLAGSMLATALMLAVVHTTGFLDVLTRAVVGAAALVVFSAALAASSLRAPAGHLHDCVRDLALPFVLPAEALVLTARARSFAFLGVAGSIVLLAYTGWISYLAPSDGWDGIVYHESMVGYAIQNHGYALASTPANLVHINTFPRNCEMTNLWFVLFWDRRLIDIVNNAYSVPLALAVFCLCRRYSSTIDALGWTSCFILVPGYSLQLHSNYIDIHAASFYFAGLHFGTRLALRLRDALVASLCYGLLLGAKSFALAWTPVLCFVTILLLCVRHFRTRPRAVVGALVAGLALLLAFGAPIYVRNWAVYHNPVYPYIYDAQTHKLSSPAIGATEFNKPLLGTITDMLAPPKPGYDYVDTRQFGYGLALPFFTAPLGLLALAVCLVRWLADISHRITKTGGDPLIQNLVLTLFAPLTTYFYTPAFWLARYNYPLIGGVFILVAWFLGKAKRFADGTIALNVVTGMMWLYWADPAWLVTFAEAKRLAHLTPAERATQTTIGWSLSRPTAEAREHLRRGEVVAYTDDIEFPAVLWNERFSNRVVYVPMTSDEGVLRELDAIGAKWFVTSRLAPFFDRQTSWRRVGPVSGRPLYAYERIQ